VAFSLVLEEPLRVRGPPADMDWTGRFALTRRPEMPPQATGMLRTQDGRVSMLGHDFDIETATIRFPEEGDLDPFVDLVATTDTAEALVTMLIRGRASRPQLILRSEPPMPESDVFALLITGRADADEANQKEFSAKAAGVLAAVNNSALQRHLREKVGIDRVGVGFGDTVDQPIVTVGKRINDKIYVEAGYHHNAPRGVNEAELRLEYRFAPPRWSVETFFGDAAQGGVGLWWQRRYMTRGQRAAFERRAKGESPAAGPVSEGKGGADAAGTSPSSAGGGGSPR
jgi:autotransporter translocation and assembly factor TamB